MSAPSIPPVAHTISAADGKMLARTDGAIGWLIFNQPEKRNAVSLDMWAAVPDLIAGFEADPNIRAIVVTGGGDETFIAGADISEFETTRASPVAVQQYEHTILAALDALRHTLTPTIAFIRGFCFGGGLGVAISCDLRIAAQDALFCIPAARLGLGYEVAGFKPLIDLVGPANAKEIFFTARRISAAEAHHMGLINTTAPSADLAATLATYTDAIAANAPLTMAAAKRAIEEYGKDPADRDLATCEAMVKACYASADYTEGRTAFIEKRKPAFRGS